MTLYELLDILSPSMSAMSPACSLLDAVRLTHSAIVNRMIQVRSDALVEVVDVDISLGDDIGYLPSNFLSLQHRPQIVGGAFLSALPSSDTSTLETVGTPRYYAIVGKLIQVYPPTDSAINLKLFARLRPAAPEDMEDDLPFNGDLDQVYVDGTMAILSGGLEAMNSKAYLPGIQMQVDQILSGSSGDDEQMLADSINGL